VIRGEKDKLTLAKDGTSTDNNRLMQELSNERKGNHESSADLIRNKLAAMRSKNSGNKMGIRKLCKYQLWKSIFDRLFGLLATIALSPLLILICILIRLDSPGNPVFRQERIGKDGRSFFIYKFRTMHIEHDDSLYKEFIQSYVSGEMNGEMRKKKELLKRGRDPRITRFGNILRRTNLDELLQLINLVKGNMSLVGPRPDIPFAVSMYQDRHLEKFRVMPGITGMWQVSGRKKVMFEEQIRLDMKYIKKQSLLLDIKIILLTIRTILKGDGS